MLQVVEQGRSLDSVFQSDWFQSLPAEKRDLALSREIVFGLCRWYVLLESLLAGRLQKPLRARDRDIEIVLLIGLYQLLIMGTEAHAAVNETVKLALAQKKKWASGLVNAVLRGVLRDELGLGVDADARAYPHWMRAKLQLDWKQQASGNHDCRESAAAADSASGYPYAVMSSPVSKDCSRMASRRADMPRLKLPLC